MQAEESKQTSEKVFEDRNLTLDAQIVRLMKSKKQMKLQDLINEVIDAVKKLFHPEVKAIKTQVDSLIEREVSVGMRVVRQLDFHVTFSAVHRTKRGSSGRAYLFGVVWYGRACGPCRDVPMYICPGAMCLVELDILIPSGTALSGKTT